MTRNFFRMYIASILIAKKFSGHSRKQGIKPAKRSHRKKDQVIARCDDLMETSQDVHCALVEKAGIVFRELRHA